MPTHKITLIPGDGIGPEVVKATVRMLEATGVKFEWESFAAGAEAYEKYKEYIPKELSESIERPLAAASQASMSNCASVLNSSPISGRSATCRISRRSIRESI
jgi:isocitrate/isopropylmalate dehydrogenase